ncbi:glutamic acid-rich protein isoform X1 [Drosophila erecta]|uniref:glutamic acid-rich protein isoform X1 n=1 Tax=Drosophila erecta TaxID=7220 RepID=UPI000732A20F|nr:glutamic acid-rich protein isoform X1 [Drosophila erecta]XP_015009925.1 glutamic acid-rich protein isoform X1 [Drosophila erecta]XP_026832052.1 glutamic acid-rich protein isoform X1 [Drosophila erecta]XP_026832053.1 glutamic acid-rich protein isoform X1 [Drosophila erecta]XP_026832054.1 glutamic acid-rich protein isoform X1 [Drosophila erecta]XP_026832055.1 glutamic acid-rich protein isoform X1 [Drosophila erecta]XP_026832056.1 glutamic acid-rich protein isoform X1 [Drosophila erecta]KQS3
MPFVTPRAGTSSASSAPGGRTTFRPPWVKDDGGTTATSSTTKPNATPWAKKTATTTTAAPATKENGEKSTATKPKVTATTTAAAKKTTTPEPAKKATEPVKKSSLATSTTVAKKTPEPVNTKKAPEPVKKVAPTVGTKKPVATTSVLKKKKEPTPPPESSSEEEESEEEEETEEETESEEEESEEESESEEEESEEEEDTTVDEKVPEHVKKAAQLRPTTVNKKPEPESELSQRFTVEKPKLRSVVVKRDKSLKKMATEDDDEAEEGETEEERDRRRRFKLEKPKLRHVKREEKPLPSKSTDDLAKIRPVLKKVPKIDELLKEPKEDPKPEFTTKTLRKASIKREPSIKSVPAPPPLPSLVPKAPPPPPPPLAPGEKRVLSSTQKETLEKLRTRPRRRPDWSEMMKEVESGKKLRHVACNDRSQPILTCKSITKLDDKFIYETEKGNSHNKLLKQIQGGIKLKPTKTNDRSKPVLDGLRKFRRQMTIEEQLQKSQSKINMLSEAPSSHALGPGSATALGAGGSRPSIVSAMSIDEESPDELDDIDKIRDDLQSTKQMLALELRNREAQDRENKKLLAKIRTLETELEREKSREKNLEYGSNVIVATMDPTPTAEQTYVNSLKREVEDARKVSKEVEQNYQSTAEQLVEAKTEIEEQRRQIQLLERKLAAALQGGGSLDGSRRPSDANFGRDSSPELEPEVSESDPDEPEEKKVERRERRSGKELKILRSKLTKLKVKEEAAKKEKDALKQAMKKNQGILKEENKKFKKLEKEVQKMAASMKLDEDDVDGEEKDEDEEEAEEEHASEEEEESDDESEESESEESEAETGSESEPEDSPNSAKKANVEPRVKKHESRFAAMKKCNVLLQANVDNLQDQIVQVRSRATNLQDELDAVIADLGF